MARVDDGQNRAEVAVVGLDHEPPAGPQLVAGCRTARLTDVLEAVRSLEGELDLLAATTVGLRASEEGAPSARPARISGSLVDVPVICGVAMRVIT
jgi:hypothetical protein